MIVTNFDFVVKVNFVCGGNYSLTMTGVISGIVTIGNLQPDVEGNMDSSFSITLRDDRIVGEKDRFNATVCMAEMPDTCASYNAISK